MALKSFAIKSILYFLFSVMAGLIYAWYTKTDFHYKWVVSGVLYSVSELIWKKFNK